MRRETQVKGFEHYLLEMGKTLGGEIQLPHKEIAPCVCISIINQSVQPFRPMDYMA